MGILSIQNLVFGQGQGGYNRPGVGAGQGYIDPNDPNNYFLPPQQQGPMTQAFVGPPGSLATYQIPVGGFVGPPASFVPNGYNRPGNPIAPASFPMSGGGGIRGINLQQLIFAQPPQGTGVVAPPPLPAGFVAQPLPVQSNPPLPQAPGGSGLLYPNQTMIQSPVFTQSSAPIPGTFYNQFVGYNQTSRPGIVNIGPKLGPTGLVDVPFIGVPNTPNIPVGTNSGYVNITSSSGGSPYSYLSQYAGTPLGQSPAQANLGPRPSYTNPSLLSPQQVSLPPAPLQPPSRPGIFQTLGSAAGTALSAGSQLLNAYTFSQISGHGAPGPGSQNYNAYVAFNNLTTSQQQMVNAAVAKPGTIPPVFLPAAFQYLGGYANQPIPPSPYGQQIPGNPFQYTQIFPQAPLAQANFLPGYQFQNFGFSQPAPQYNPNLGPQIGPFGVGTPQAYVP